MKTLENSKLHLPPLTVHYAGEEHRPIPGTIWQTPNMESCYRDTPKEKLNAIVSRILEGKPWREVITEEYATIQPWLYKIITSANRDLFLQHNPPQDGSAVLDIGAGWGQLSLPLMSRKDLQVVVLEPTPERLRFIHAVAEQEAKAQRTFFLQADFTQIELLSKFDLILCNGVLEWVPTFVAGEVEFIQINFLKKIKRLLNPGGKCVVGIENRFGLKYWLGARDDHTGTSHISSYDFELAREKHSAAVDCELRVATHTLAEYKELFQAAGFRKIQSFAAFPDYKIPEIILPMEPPAIINEYILRQAICEEHDGHDGGILPFQKELRSHYRSLAKLGIAGIFAPSFFFILQ